MTRPCFESTLHGTRVLSLGLAVWIILFAAIPLCFCRERYDRSIARQEKVPILKGIAETMRNRPFLLLTLSVTLMFFGFYASSALGMYLNIYYIFGGVEKDASTYVGLSGTLWKVSSLAALPVIVLISRRFDKRNTFVVSMILSLFGAVGGWWCIDPERPWLQVLPSILYGPGISCVLMLSDSMLADICDLDELRGGVRREAMFGAIYGWFTKVGLTIALALSGLLLVCTGFDVKFGAGQPEGTVFLMRVLAVTVPASGMLTAILLMAGYRLNAGRMAEVKRELDARRRGSRS